MFALRKEDLAGLGGCAVAGCRLVDRGDFVEFGGGDVGPVVGLSD